MSRLAFVVPRYGPNILGGAETMAREMAERLVARGHSVTALTTCMHDYATWANVDAPGRSESHGVVIERFVVAEGWRTPETVDLWARLPHLSIDEQYAWLHHLPHAPGLYQYLIDRGAEFDLIFFIPYLYSTTYYGSGLVNERAVIWPCLHNELFAYFHPTRAMLATARGVQFNAEAEQELSHRLGARNPREAVIGFGVDRDLVGDGERFRQEIGLGSPYLIYSGRLEEAKNFHTLHEYFIRYKQLRGGDLKLVVMGDGPLRRTRHAPDLIYIGFRRDQAMYDAIAGAIGLVQPSLYESFSIVIMEAWALGIPVIVHSGSAVTSDHVVRSRGGWAFGSFDQFARALDALTTDRDLGPQLGRNGRDYVRDQYDWEVVLDRMERALREWSHEG